MRSLFVSTLVLLAGCDLYFSDGDDQPPCANVGAPEITDNQLRNPDTGQCEPFGHGNCDFACGPCPDYGQIPNWSSCFDACTAHIDELSCATDPACHVVYDANSHVDEPPAFRECWGLPPVAPIEPVLACENLNAGQCTSRTDCITMYDDIGGDFLVFNRCVAENLQTCYNDQECGAGTHCSVSDGECLPCEGPPGTDCPAVCVGYCVPDSSSCEAVDCAPGTHCEEQCTVEPNGPVTCSPTCVPDTDSCAGTSCPPGTECQEVCADDPNNPGCGTCTVQCVPLDACEAVADEATCQGRSDCNPIYVGTDCTCYENGTCECEVLTYDHCEKK